MLRSLYSGISGMKGFQTKLDVIGNNIANVNTVGFKKGRVMFQDILSQNISGITAPAGNRGGVNPRQVGLGVQVGAIDTIHTPGSPMSTGVLTDLTIAGDGFFLIGQSGADNFDNPLYTRAGNFYLDAERNLVTSDGNFVLGMGANGELDRIQIPNTFDSYDITRNGEIIGIDAEGQQTLIGTLALGIVDNPQGLRKVGGSLYELTGNANADGQHNFNTIDGHGVASQIISGQLEMSNVDLTEEFTEMIVAQRGFQANSRIITTSDEILQEVVNLKR